MYGTKAIITHVYYTYPLSTGCLVYVNLFSLTNLLKFLMFVQGLAYPRASVGTHFLSKPIPTVR